MTTEQLVIQLTGRVAAIEYLLAQTMAIVMRDRADPAGSLADLRARFEKSAPNLDDTQPEARPAAEDAATRLYDTVGEHLPG